MADLKWDQCFANIGSFKAPTVTSLVKRPGPIGGLCRPKKPASRLRSPPLTVRHEASSGGNESFCARVFLHGL